jgi:outer membrane lipoprotein SlyB
MNMKIATKNSGALWAGVISGLVTQVCDTVALCKGKMEKKEYALQTAENVSSAVGITMGVEYGAMLGSAVFPGVGTAIGSIVGGIVGDQLGRYVGHHTGKIVYNQPVVKVKAENVSVINNMEGDQQA